MISWSNQVATFPCFSGIVSDIPSVHKEFAVFLFMLCYCH